MIRGENNIIQKEGARFTNVLFDIEGNNNRIFIDNTSELNNVKFYIRGNGNRIVINQHCVFNCYLYSSILWNIYIEDNCNILTIGERSIFHDIHFALTEGKKIIIVNDCLFSSDIDIRTGDSHSIFSDGKRINQAKDVLIHNHVWVGAHCSILKGSAILENSIVATRSVVTKQFDKSGVIIAGNPAGIIKEGINWKHERI
jgi:acetyltransferase-like isoleucine patch superfamily enzyme